MEQEGSMAVKTGNRVQFAAIKNSKKAKMESIKQCFASLLNHIDMKFGKMTISGLPY